MCIYVWSQHEDDEVVAKELMTHRLIQMPEALEEVNMQLITHEMIVLIAIQLNARW